MSCAPLRNCLLSWLPAETLHYYNVSAVKEIYINCLLYSEIMSTTTKLTISNLLYIIKMFGTNYMACYVLCTLICQYYYQWSDVAWLVQSVASSQNTTLHFHYRSDTPGGTTNHPLQLLPPPHVLRHLSDFSFRQKFQMGSF